MPRFYKYFLTINHFSVQDVENAEDDIKTAQYGIYAKEKGEKENTPHLHIFLHWKNKRSWNAVQKRYPRANIQQGKGSDLEAQTYLKKGGDYKESGNPTTQGERKDLGRLVHSLKKGETSVQEILLEDPTTYHQYGRTLCAVEDVVRRGLSRSWTTRGRWFWGPTGVGKSHLAFEGYHESTHYVKPLEGGDLKWWDGYTGQQYVIIEEFRAELSFGNMLKLLDKWPYKVSRRGREPAPFLAKWVFITSCSPPDCTWDMNFDMNKHEKMEQLKRRCDIYEITHLPYILLTK